MKKPYEQLIGITRAALHGEPYSGELEPEAVLPLARAHQLEHILAHAMAERDDARLSTKLYNAVWLAEQQRAALAEASALLSEAGIDHLPLKGSVLREHYPEPWIRNSCDVDILVKDADLESAATLLSGAGYVRDEEGKSAHDVVFTRGCVALELHYTLIESYRFPNMATVLESVWERTAPTDGHRYAMTDEMFYFYHIAHMVKHFENGGCGIRSFTDLWVLNHRLEFDPLKRETLLALGGIDKFASAALDLAERWFGDGREANEELARFVISGGAYGSVEAAAKVKRSRHGGRVKYLLTRLFVPYEQLRRYYPMLERHPYLTPVYQVVRWFSALKRRDVYARELKSGVEGGEDSLSGLLSDLGLK